MENKNNTVLQLIKELNDSERMKRAIEMSLEDSNEALNKASFIDRLFRKKSLQEWAENKERCEHDISEYKVIETEIKEELTNLGYNSNEIKKIQEAMQDDNFYYYLEQDHSWIKLLDKLEMDALFIEVATDRYESYSSLMSLTNYIDSFKMDAEKLDFIHGFQPEYKAVGEQSDAYKIGALFYDTGFSYGVDLDEPSKTMLHDTGMI